MKNIKLKCVLSKAALCAVILCTASIMASCANSSDSASNKNTESSAQTTTVHTSKTEPNINTTTTSNALTENTGTSGEAETAPQSLSTAPSSTVTTTAAGSTTTVTLTNTSVTTSTTKKKTTTTAKKTTVTTKKTSATTVNTTLKPLAFPQGSANSEGYISDRTSSGFTLHWKAVSNADGYDVYVYNDKSGSLTLYKSGITDTKLVVKGLASGDKITYKIIPYEIREIKPETTTTTTTSAVTTTEPLSSSATEPTVTTAPPQTSDVPETTTVPSQASGIDAAPLSLDEPAAAAAPRKPKTEKVNLSKTYTIFGATKLKSVSVTAKGTAKAVDVSWASNSKADGYNIYYSFDKNGSYTRYRAVDSKHSIWKISGLNKAGDCYVKVVPYVSYKGYCFEGEEKIVSAKVYENDLNAILGTYKQSKSITVTNSDFKLSSTRKNKIMNLINNYSATNTSGFVVLDINSGAMIAYNADWYVNTASTVKAPYICYVMSQEIDKGKASLSEMLTYKKEFYKPYGSGIIQYDSFGSKYSIKTVIEYILYYSDNMGYYMLQNRFGVKGYNEWLTSLGCKTFINGKDIKWGQVSPRDSAKIWVEIYKYINEGKYASFLKEELLTTGYSPIRKNLGSKYQVANKFGGADVGWHDTGIVFKKGNPYIMILLTNDCYLHPDYYFQNEMIKQLDGLHDDLIKYNASK